MQPTHVMIICVLFLYCSTVQALSAYDCRDPNAPYSQIDLLDTAPCDDPESDYKYPINATAQILQVATKYPIESYKCQVIRTEEVTRCGFTSITYGSEYPVYEENMIISTDDCEKAYKTKRIVILG